MAVGRFPLQRDEEMAGLDFPGIEGDTGRCERV
jgi:hypothetical protein